MIRLQAHIGYYLVRPLLLDTTGAIQPVCRQMAHNKGDFPPHVEFTNTRSTAFRGDYVAGVLGSGYQAGRYQGVA